MTTTPENDANRADRGVPPGSVPFETIERDARDALSRVRQSALSFDADFENGTLGGVVRLGLDWYHIGLRPDTHYRFHFRVRGCGGREVVFEFACRNIKDPRYNEGRWTWSVNNPPTMPVVSYDGRNWRPVDHFERHEQEIGMYRFRHRFDGDEAYLCHQHPYTYSDLLDWLRALPKPAGLVVDVLGRTRNGFPQPVLTVAEESASRDLAVLIAREDADETTGSWGIEGLVGALLGPAFQELRARCTFKIVPMVGIDGVVAGAHHSAGYGYGGCRWHEDPSPAEIETVKNGMRQWVRQGYRLKLAGKLHGHHSFGMGDCLCDGVKTPLPALKKAFEEGLTRYSCGAWSVNRGEVTIRPQGFFERFVLDEFGALETFATHICGGSPDQARRGGEALLHGIERWLTSGSSEQPRTWQRMDGAHECRTTGDPTQGASTP